MPALVDRRFPSTMTGRVRKWLLSTSLFDADRYHGSVEDERKLFYVAVTRARDGLGLSHFRRMAQRAGRSRFLDELGLVTSAPPRGPFIDHVPHLLASDDEVLSFSASEIIEYLRCPHFYRLRTLWGYPGGVVPELGYGKSIHHILHLLAERAREGQDPQQELDRLVDQHFHLPYAPSGEAAALRDAARRMLQRYLAQHCSEFAHVEEVEARIEFQLGRLGANVATVKGRVDVITSPEGKRRLRDYKTAHEPGEGDGDDARLVQEAALQISLYVLGEHHLGRPVDGASIAFLKSGEMIDVPIDAHNLKHAERQALGAVEGILQKSFTGRRCRFCDDCDYRHICSYTHGRRRGNKRYSS